jgi:hypothetical protein
MIKKSSAEGSCWWARQDSNLQPDRYERLGSLGSIDSDCGYSFWRVPFIAICSRHIGGQSVVGGKSQAAPTPLTIIGNTIRDAHVNGWGSVAEGHRQRGLCSPVK